MTTTESAAQEQKLGGGLVLLPNFTVSSPTHTFKLGQPYSLGRDAFRVEPGLLADASTGVNLARLGGVSQLQVLTRVSVGGRILAGQAAHTFSHNRLVHSMGAAALDGIMAPICGLSGQELAIGLLAEAMHDGFTPASGDVWKDINHQGTLFDEDHGFAGKIMKYHKEGWPWLCDKYGFDPKRTADIVESIVQGRGLRGDIHEIADTASYMLLDLQEVKSVCEQLGVEGDFAEILQAAQPPWDIWNYAAEKDGRVVITDPIALNNFLFLRVLLWKNLYQNPRRKVLEVLMQRIVYPWLVSKGKVITGELLKMDDRQLFSIVEAEMGWASGQSHDLNLFGSFPKIKTFATWAEALVFENKQHASGAFTMVFSVKDFQRTKDKTDKYLVFDKDGRVGTFKTVHPRHAAVVENMAQASISSPLPIYVVYVKHPQISDNLRQAWQEARARWVKRVE